VRIEVLPELIAGLQEAVAASDGMQASAACPEKPNERRS
jgi:hypothetical protein